METAKTLAILHMMQDGFMPAENPDRSKSDLPWWCDYTPVRTNDDKVKQCRGAVPVGNGKVPVRRKVNSS